MCRRPLPDTCRPSASRRCSATTASGRTHRDFGSKTHAWSSKAPPSEQPEIGRSLLWRAFHVHQPLHSGVIVPERPDDHLGALELRQKLRHSTHTKRCIVGDENRRVLARQFGPMRAKEIRHGFYKGGGRRRRVASIDQQPSMLSTELALKKGHGGSAPFFDGVGVSNRENRELTTRRELGCD